MALDLSPYAEKEDIPEVAALKKRIIEVMERATARHGWCEEARNAMIEAGVIDQTPETIPVTVTLTSGVVIKKNILLKDLVGKDEDQQKRAVARSMGSLRIRDGYNTVGTLEVKPVDIAALSNDPVQPAGWRKFGTRGAVAHYVDDAAMVRAHANPGATIYSICERAAVQASEMHPADGQRHCVRCTAKLG